MRELLEKICQDPKLEAQWLDTISLLEFIGARKISRTVANSHPSLMVLEHHADETRHAFAFKKLSRELRGNDSTHYLCPEEAISYFQKLDHQMSDWITQLVGEKDTYVSYLLTTSLIERRAMKLYPLYRSITKYEFIKEELHRVILEEANHREEIERQAEEILNKYGKTLDDAEVYEQDLFGSFSKHLMHSLNNP